MAKKNADDGRSSPRRGRSPDTPGGSGVSGITPSPAGTAGTMPMFRTSAFSFSSPRRIPSPAGTSPHQRKSGGMENVFAARKRTGQSTEHVPFLLLFVTVITFFRRNCRFSPPLPHCSPSLPERVVIH